ncbi:23S rRNA (pseudouridine(1915)-N(3))-methyltransferase RlmH [Puteibacter caeruleilacunae]|nr:23S rRNA (pseudouridine(1915)-N(3))-methyltransferase RlmH [Puteibacter caeruleilacunae]
MKVILIVVGKTDQKYLEEGIGKYVKRIPHYIPFEMRIIPDIKNTKNLSVNEQKDREGKTILNGINNSDHLILLDEKGKDFKSTEFAAFMQKKMNAGLKNLVFLIGGPYGFSPDVYARANGKISLSKMTFSHQLVRILFVEQLYRAMTIIKGEPYHHE